MADKKMSWPRPKALIVVFSGAALISVAIPLIPYAIMFHSQPASNDPQMWSAFGGYFAGTAGPLISLVNLAGVIFIATIVSKFQQDEQRLYDREERRRQNTYDFHREWNAESMFVTRTLASKVISKKNAPTLDKLDTEGNPEEAARVWIVSAFYHRLSLAIQHDQIENKLVPRLFGDTFYWWYRNCFYNQLRPTGWESWDDIDLLWKWLCNNASKTERDRWVQRWGESPDSPSQKPINPKPQP
jgi:hypothetical protein